MSLFRRFVDASMERRDATLSELLALRDGRYRGTYAGVGVNYLNAFTHDAVWACRQRLTDSIATLPVAAFRKRAERRERLPTQPPIVTTPSGVLEVEEFIGQILGSVFENGNAYGQIVARDALGFPTQLEIRDHIDVVVKRMGKTGPPVYRIDGREVPADDVVHFRGITRPGSVVGIPVIDAAREAVARGLAAERFSAEWFASGAHPSSILKSDQKIPDEATARTIKERFLAAIRGREPAVLGLGLDYKEVQSNPQASQLIETERFITEKIARFFGIPPEKIGAASSGSNITYANRESRAIDYVTDGVLPWLVRIERPWSRLLPRDQFVRFIVDGLLRADSKTRAEVHNAAIRGGWRSPNEARLLEDAEPITDGNKFLWPPFASGSAV